MKKNTKCKPKTTKCKPKAPKSVQSVKGVQSVKVKSDNVVKKGRPCVKYDIAQVEAFGSVKASYQHMAWFFGCTVRTIDNLMADQDGAFFQAYKSAFANTCKNLAKMQYDTAMGNGGYRPSTTMQIWLGKQWLDQKDKSESNHTESKTVFIIPPGMMSRGALREMNTIIDTTADEVKQLDDGDDKEDKE